MSRLIQLLLACLGLYLLWTVCSWGYASFIGHVAAGAAVQVKIDHALTNEEAAHLLKDTYHLIDSTNGYRLYTALARVSGAKVGTYDVYAGERYADLAHKLARGQERVEREVRVIEGWTIKDEADQLSAMNTDWRAEFIRLVGQPANTASFDVGLRTQYSFLQTLAADRSLDGYLFPDTYRVWEDELPHSLVQKQLKTFDQKVYQVYKDVPLPAPLKTFDEAVILASIIEKEVQTPVDRKIVAGLFLRRLREGMALQSDATLTYVTGSTRGRATAQELSLESEFNSYKQTGLPPSPISGPAVSAFEAVFHPTSSTYRYFLTDQNNKVLYASTFEEHIRNKQRAGY